MTIAVPDFQRLDHVSLREAVYRELKHLLLTQRFDPEARLNVQQIEHQLGVSRTPLNDALQRLSAEGFIEARPRRGFFVRRPTIQEAMEIFDLRLLHERFAAERAVDRAGPREIAQLRAILDRQRPCAVVHPTDDQYDAFSECDRAFHRALVEAARHRRLAALYGQLDSHIQMTYVYYVDARTTMGQTFQEHQAIVDALAARDAGALNRRLIAHIERFRRLVQKHLAEATAETPR